MCYDEHVLYERLEERDLAIAQLEAEKAASQRVVDALDVVAAVRPTEEEIARVFGDGDVSGLRELWRAYDDLAALRATEGRQ